jgi:hypothetical protein
MIGKFPSRLVISQLQEYFSVSILQDDGNHLRIGYLPPLPLTFNACQQVLVLELLRRVFHRHFGGQAVVQGRDSVVGSTRFLVVRLIL